MKLLKLRTDPDSTQLQAEPCHVDIATTLT